MIQLSQAALKELKRLQAKQLPLQPVVRLSIVPGGCASWRYILQFDNEMQSTDCCWEYGEVRVVVAQTILSDVDEITVDYAEDLMGGSFRFVNPNATHTCGCGISFSTNTAADSLFHEPSHS